MPVSITPYQLQGFLYPTPRRTACNEYLKCPRCSLCANFNVHDARCTYCESRKTPPRRCDCNLSSKESIFALHQSLGVRQLVFDSKESSVVMETGGNKELQSITDEIERQNIISPIRQKS